MNELIEGAVIKVNAETVELVSAALADIKHNCKSN
jgi:hypothetical protein